MVGGMEATTDRLVMVPATPLDDLIELATRAYDRLPEDALRSALRGAIAEVRTSLVVEP